MSVTVESQFKGMPILGIKYEPEDKLHALQFGVKKAKLILEHSDEIRIFVEKYSK